MTLTPCTSPPKVSLPLSTAHRDKLHELYCRAAARRAPRDDPAFLRALFCVLLRYESVGGAGHQAPLRYSPPPPPHLLSRLQRTGGQAAWCAVQGEVVHARKKAGHMCMRMRMHM